MTNKEQKKMEAKWEKILKKHGLGVHQPMTDNSEGEMAEFDQKTHANNNVTNHEHTGDSRRIDMSKLRGKVDGSDAFMDGHQIQKVRSMDREVPDWALNNREVKKILLKSFPKLKTNSKQRASAGRWIRIIHLYYRMKLPKQVVSRELKINEIRLTRLIQSISYAANGKNVNGKPRKERRHPSNTL